MTAKTPKILVTRPLPDGEATSVRLAALGYDPVLLPLMRMQPLHAALPAPDAVAGLVLTSANALRALTETGRLAPYTSLPAYAVGAGTAARARKAGFTAIHEAEGDLASLAALLRKQHPAKPLFHPHAVHVSGDLATLLAPAGIRLIAAEVCVMTALGSLPREMAEALQAGSIDAALFYSRRTAEIFRDLAAGLFDDERKRHFAALCLSENIAAPLLAAGFSAIHLADCPSEEAMMALALSFLRRQIG